MRRLLALARYTIARERFYAALAAERRLKKELPRAYGAYVAAEERFIERGVKG